MRMLLRTEALVLSALLLSPAVAAAGDKVILTMREEIVSADLLIALEEGYFEEQGLEVEVVTWNGSGSMLPAVAQGRIDFAPTSSFSPSYVNVIRRGAPIRLVAARAVHQVGECGYASFVARSELIDSGRLGELSSLRGLRVATDRTAASFYYWARLLERAGLEPDDVEMRRVPAELKVQALTDGLIDVTSTIEPKVHRLVSSGAGKVWLPVSAAVPDRQNTFLLFGPRLLQERRDLGRRVMAAFLRGVEQYREGKTDRNVEILAMRTQLRPEELRQMCWPRSSADGRIDPEGLVDYQEWVLAAGLIDGVVPFGDLVDEGFLPMRSEPSSSSP